MRFQIGRNIALLFLAAAIALGSVGKALADTGIETIVVTAEKHETLLQDTPIAVSAFGPEAIQNQRIENASDLGALVPSLTFAKTNNQQQISIRGIGFDNAFVTSQEGVALYIDGVYMGRPAIALATYNDLDRIEVLRGPQGTLFGRNAIGGAISLITQLPSDSFGANASLTVGDYGLVEAAAGLTGPLSDSLSGRISFSWQSRNGYTRNLISGKSVDFIDGDFAARGSLRYAPSTVWDDVVRADFELIRSGGPVNHPYNPFSTAPKDEVQFTGAGGRYVNDPYKVFDLLPGRWIQQFTGVSNTLSYNAGWAVLKSITAYRDTRDSQQTDLNGDDGFDETLYVLRPPTDWGQIAWQVSQELQALGQIGSRFEWQAGVFYYHENEWVNVINQEDCFCAPDHLIMISYFLTQVTDSAAVYGQASYQLSDTLKLVGGARYSYDHGDFNLTLTGPGFSHRSWDAFTPKVGLEWRPEDGELFYATINRGYKAGGFNGYPGQVPYNPESLWDFEIGSKSVLFDNRLVMDWAAYYYDYTHTQVTQYTFLGPDISNVGGGKAEGVELDLYANPFDHLLINASAAYEHSAYDKFFLKDLILGVPVDVGGNPFVKTPEWSFTLGPQYTIPLDEFELLLRYDWSYKSSFNFSAFDLVQTRQKAYSISNASISLTLPDSNFRIMLWGKNLFNAVVFNQNIEASSLLMPGVAYAPPRTVGITLSARW